MEASVCIPPLLLPPPPFFHYYAEAKLRKRLLLFVLGKMEPAAANALTLPAEAAEEAASRVGGGGGEAEGGRGRGRGVSKAQELLVQTHPSHTVPQLLRHNRPGLYSPFPPLCSVGIAKERRASFERGRRRRGFFWDGRKFSLAATVF